jgi:hypothetical protein
MQTIASFYQKLEEGLDQFEGNFVLICTCCWFHLVNNLRFDYRGWETVVSGKFNRVQMQEYIHGFSVAWKLHRYFINTIFFLQCGRRIPHNFGLFRLLLHKHPIVYMISRCWIVASADDTFFFYLTSLYNLKLKFSDLNRKKMVLNQH